MKTRLGPFSKELVHALGDDKTKIMVPPGVADDAYPEKHPDDVLSEMIALALIEEALSRLDSGTYGLCSACGTEMSVHFLERNPVATVCECCSDETEPLYAIERLQ